MRVERTFLDVNVFMYAAGAPHPLKDSWTRIVNDVEVGALGALVNTEILQELLYRYSHIGLASKGIQLCRDILAYPLVVLPVAEADIRLAVELFDSYQQVGLKPRDAVRAATMRNNDVTRLTSADAHFDHLPFVARIDPLTYPLAD